VYLELCIKAIEEENGRWKKLYKGIDETLEGFRKAYEKMTADKDKEMYLIFKSGY
jgi:hypothetical protein